MLEELPTYLDPGLVGKPQVARERKIWITYKRRSKNSLGNLVIIKSELVTTKKFCISTPNYRLIPSKFSDQDEPITSSDSDS